MKPIVALLVLCAVFQKYAKSTSVTFSVNVPLISSEMVIDGIMDEPDWEKATVIDKFWEHYPVDSIVADKATTVYILAGDEFLYIAAHCSDSRDKPIIQTLNRDDQAGFWRSDAFSVIIDPQNTQRNGYFFGVIAGGAQIDAQLSQSSYFPNDDYNWNNKWHSTYRKVSDGFMYEMAIPFSILSFDSKSSEWRINFMRNDMEGSYRYFISSKFDISKDGRDLTELGTLKFCSAPQSKKNRVTIIPSVSGNINKSISTELAPVYNYNYGFDAKLNITQTINLDLMVIPDFSHVDVDKEYIDFYRYEYYMLENRQFFLENSDIFTDFKSGNFSPVYTRRIGIQDWQNVPLWGGAKLTGSIGNKTKFGFITALTDRYNATPTTNYTIGSFRQKLGKQGELKILSTNVIPQKDSLGTTHYNSTAGIDYLIRSKNGKWYASTGISKSFTPARFNNSYYYKLNLNYISKRLRLYNSLNHANSNYINQLGFMPYMFRQNNSENNWGTERFGITEFQNKAEFYIYPKDSKRVGVMFPFVANTIMLDDEGKPEIQSLQLGYHINLKNTAYLSFGMNEEHLKLHFPILVIEGGKLMPAGIYNTNNLWFYFRTDERRKIRYVLEGDYGSFYNGRKAFITNALSYRLQPYALIKADYLLCNLSFPSEYGHALYNLFRFQTDIYFSKNLIWTALAQFNTQKKSISINTRLKWEFSPMSNFYIVLTDKFDQMSMSNTNFGAVAKLTLWLSKNTKM